MKIRFPIALLIVIVVSATIGWVITHELRRDTGTSLHPSHPAIAHLGTHPSQAAIARRSAATVSSAPTTPPHGFSLTAVAIPHRLAIYSAPNAKSREVTLSNPIAGGAPLTLLIKSMGQSWVRAYLPTRPNGSLGWLPRRAVKLLATPWSLVVSLRSHRLTVSRAGRVVRSLTIGVGRSVTPTPTGTYFITELLKQPDPTGPYGPYAFGLSAHSGVLKHFGRGGDGQIGIHGTDQPQLIGGDASHGCIRLRNPDIIWLSQRLPLATPVFITHT